MKRVDIVIVNWNSGPYLEACLASLTNTVAEATARVIVVDNASNDDSANIEPPPGLELEIIHNAANRGFGAACNQGAARGEAEFLLFLNPDTRLAPGSLSISLERLCKDNSIAVVGIRLDDEHGNAHRSCCRLPRPRHLVARATGIDQLWPRAGYLMRDWAHDQTRTVDHVIGAFYLIRRNLFDHLGGFDERFFVYLEDLDLSKRVHAAGHACLFVADARAYHAGGGTSTQIKATRLFYSLRARLQYTHKHFGWPAILAVGSTTLFVEPLIRTVRAVLRGAWRDVGETARAYRALYRWLLT